MHVLESRFTRNEKVPVSISSTHCEIIHTYFSIYEAFSAVSLGEAEEVMRYNQMAVDSR
jgi:hypothetical protein